MPIELEMVLRLLLAVTLCALIGCQIMLLLPHPIR
jgi:hypothetical protein